MARADGGGLALGVALAPRQIPAIAVVQPANPAADLAGAGGTGVGEIDRLPHARERILGEFAGPEMDADGAELFLDLRDPEIRSRRQRSRDPFDRLSTNSRHPSPTLG